MSDGPTEPTQTEIDAMLFRCRRPGILLNKTLRPDDPGLPGCWLGGRPTLPPEIEWPWDDVTGGTPMRFLGQINLAQIPPVAAYPEMPRTGTLFFFHEGLFEEYLNNPKFSHKVIYVASDVSTHPPRRPPEMPDLSERPFFELMKTKPDEEYKRTGEYKRWNFDLLLFEDFSRHEKLAHELEWYLNDASISVRNHLERLTEDRRDPTRDIDPALHSLFGASSRSRSPERDDDMVRLSGFEYDLDLGTSTNMTVYAVWISRKDLARHDFENTQFISG